MRNVRSSYVHAPAAIAGGLGLALLMAAPVASQSPQQRQEPTDPPTITVNDLTTRPETLYGKRVQLTGNIEDVYSRSVFAIDEDALWSSAEDVIVVNPNAVDRLEEDDDVVIVGTVRPFVHREIDQFVIASGWQWSLPVVFHKRFERRPVIIAESIKREGNDREYVLDPPTVSARLAGWGKPLPRVTMPATAVMYLTADELVAKPSQYYDKTVSLIGDVDDTYGRRVFTIDDDRFWSTGEDVLVIAPAPLREDFDDEVYVHVQGKLMRFVRADVEKHLDSERRMSARFWQDFEDRPVIVAEFVRGPAGQDLTMPKDR
jgi:hypothetical protein